MSEQVIPGRPMPADLAIQLAARSWRFAGFVREVSGAPAEAVEVESPPEHADTGVFTATPTRSARFREAFETGDDSVTDFFGAPQQHELVERAVEGIARGVVRFAPGVCRVGAPGFESDCEVVVVEHFAHAERFVIDD